MKKLLFLLSIFTVLFSCSKDETPPPAPIVKYTITLSAGEGGTVSTTGGEYEAGQTVSVTATPQGEYLFKDWSDGNTNATRTITVSSNSTLTANFEKRKYPLTVNIEGEGEVFEEIVNAGRTTDYDSGTTVKLTAVPAEGWEFVGWTGALESIDNPIQLSVIESKTVTAAFEIKTYSLDVLSIQGGVVSIEEGEYQHGTVLEITATPNENYHFIGFEGIEGFSNTISITMNSDKIIQPNFLIKDDGHKQRSNTFFDENELDYLTSENFIVWWDKDYNFNNDRSYVGKSITLLNDVENVYNISLENGMEYPVGSENTYINIFLFDYWNEEGLDIIRTKFSGAGVSTDGNSMPFFPFPNTFFEWNGNVYNNILRQSLRGTLFHETYHVMQYKAGNYYGTFTYSLDNTWYTEATARWFERKYAYPDVFDGDWTGKYNGQGALNLQPQVSMWGGLENKPYFSQISWSHGNHRYEMAEFFRYLIQYNKIEESFVHQSFYSGTELLPQEYLYENIDDLEGIYGDFSSKYVSGIMYNDLELDAIKSSTEFYSTCQDPTNCNEETGVGFNNQFVSEIDETGTSGYVTPVEKNEAWSWTVVKINTSQEQSFAIDFQPDEFGNEGTQSNFKLYLTNRENNIVQEVDFKGEITVNPNIDYFLVMVNTPQRFEGWETFDYKLKLSPKE